jgi:hypothetical protein
MAIEICWEGVVNWSSVALCDLSPNFTLMDFELNAK